MFKNGLDTPRRPWLVALVCTAILCLSVGLPALRLVHAATGPNSDSGPESSKPAATASSENPAPLYGAHIPITGPTTAFHDSVASH